MAIALFYYLSTTPEEVVGTVLSLSDELYFYSIRCVQVVPNLCRHHTPS